MSHLALMVLKGPCEYGTLFTEEGDPHLSLSTNKETHITLAHKLIILQRVNQTIKALT